MKLLEMTASFGCLDHETLRLDGGVNCLCLPNERGKSTWSAFLLAMFYGVDSGERAAKGRLPAKTRYQPWSGAPMEGTILLETAGRRMVLQRTSGRGKPMGEFRAYDPDTGMDVPGLTGDNCGRVLLGVERSVFQRSAFLSGSDLTVTQDQDLARRLGSLAASGDGDESYPEAAERLKVWKNRCRYHKTGQIPETEARLRQLRGTLEAAADLRRQRLALTQDLEALETELEAMDRQQTADWNARRAQARDELAQANSRAEALAARTAVLPETEALLALAARLDAAEQPAPEADAPCPPALEGMDAGAVLPKAQRDLSVYDRLTAGTVKGGGGGLLIGLLLVPAAAAALALRQWLPGGVFLVLAAAAFVWWGLRRRANRQVEENLDRAMALLKEYNVGTRDEILLAAMDRRDRLLAREQAQRRAWETDLLLEETAAFAPDAGTPQEARAAVDRALALRREAREAGEALEEAQRQWQRYAATAPPRDPAQEELALRRAERKAQAEALRQQELALGGQETLEARRQTLEAALSDLERREQALTLAQTALDSAQAQMARTYAPRLTGLADNYLRDLTEGRYDGLILRQDFTLSVREAATGLIRPLAALSRGTQDQAWLALRLAMTRLLLPGDAPIVLDDALLTFDEARTRAALKLLEQEDRQVLVFSCRPL